jgi:hypothetical protein
MDALDLVAREVVPAKETRMITLATVARPTIARRVNRTPQTLLRWAEVREFPRSVLSTGRRYLFETQFLRWWDQARASTGIDDGRTPA